MTGLTGRRILVVEDEPMIALLIESLLEDMGCLVTRASGLAEAFAACDSCHFDAATLNIGLNGQLVNDLAAVLEQRSTPFVVVTGYTSPHFLKPFAGKSIITKPLVPEHLQTALEDAIVGVQQR